jgi:hypothetical protein
MWNFSMKTRNQGEIDLERAVRDYRSVSLFALLNGIKSAAVPVEKYTQSIRSTPKKGVLFEGPEMFPSKWRPSGGKSPLQQC